MIANSCARFGPVRSVALALLASSALVGPVAAQGADDLSQLSIEQLAQIEITSVSKRAEPISRAPSAVFVITSEDIHRSGAMTLPEALRLAPNLEVSRIDALDYTITARGFSGMESANKLLVMIDGRSVYTPLYSGVDWDQHHVLMDDVAQIEVISGPGGTLWGANAVNGVINVTTRTAFETQGGLVAATAGSLDSDLRLRYGGALGEQAAYRVYATAYKRGDLRLANGDDANDGWDGVQVGFRADWRGERDTLTFQGDVHDNAIEESLGATDGYVRGGNLLGRWDRRFANGATLSLQAYFDRTEREARLIYDSLDASDIQGQYSFSPLQGHQVVVGGGYRITEDEFRTLLPPNLLDPTSRRVTTSNLFIQDEITLTGDLSLTLGLKQEENSYTGQDYMPNIRLAWRPNERMMLWAAISRAVRNPSRIERDFSIPGFVVPGRFDAEKLLAYEIGYRGRPMENASISLSLFYHDYDDLRTNDFTAAPAVLPIYVGNSMRGQTYGLEAWGAYDVTPRWRLSGGFSLLGKEIELKPGSLDIARFEAAGADPDYWIKARSQFKLTDRLDLDVRLRAYGEIPALTAAGYVGVPAYVEADIRLGWRVTDSAELSIGAANLLHDQHPEATETRRNEPPRSLFAGLRWTY